MALNIELNSKPLKIYTILVQDVERVFFFHSEQLKEKETKTGQPNFQGAQRL
jgi:hypothetical protein